MKQADDATEVTIAYIGGGSLNWAPKLMADLAHDTRLAPEVRLYDIDHDAAARNAALGARFAAVSRGTPARTRAALSLAEALAGADVVVVSILPGSFADMAQDIAIPARYGIPQAVGDTVGPGGFVRALRAIPMLLDIGRAIAEHAPDAFVANLTNPMSVLTGALYRAHPGIRAWGACHEVQKLRKLVALIANREAGAALWDWRDVEVNVLGINHFTFVDQIALGGRDWMPAYLDFAARHAASGFIAEEPDPDDEFARYFKDRSRVAFDLAARFGIAAAAGDRHLAEFLPAADYLAAPARWGFALTPVDYRVRDRAAKKAATEALASGARPPVAERSDEALVDQIAALMSGGHHVSNVNLENRGQIAGLPEGAIVETNALFSGLGITPLLAGRLPAAVEVLVRDHAERQTALLDAVATARWGDLFGLFRSDPLIKTLEETEARRMFAEMLDATAAALPAGLVAREAA